MDCAHVSATNLSIQRHKDHVDGGDLRRDLTNNCKSDRAVLAILHDTND